jgi:hypothetical protein
MAATYWIKLFVDWMALPTLALLLGVLFYRKYQKEFPFFVAYVLAADAVGLSRLVASHSARAFYYYVYWISDVVVAVFAFVATYELFIKRLFPAFYKVRLFRNLFPIVAAVITVFGALTALYGGKLAVLLITVRAYELLRLTILFFFVALMVVMGRRWSKPEFGIAFGFGLDVSATFAMLAIFARNGNVGGIVNRVPTLAYDFACLIWLYCFWTARKSASIPSAPLSTEALHEAKRWEESLKDFVSHGKR